MQIRFPRKAQMTCPHCHVAFKGEWQEFAEGTWEVWSTACAACDRLVVMLRHYVLREPIGNESRQFSGGPPKLESERMVWPRAVARTPIPLQVPESIAKDYSAACRVLPESPEASAALSRRCLQHLLVV